MTYCENVSFFGCTIPRKLCSRYSQWNECAIVKKAMHCAYLMLMWLNEIVFVARYVLCLHCCCHCQRHHLFVSIYIFGSIEIVIYIKSVINRACFATQLCSAHTFQNASGTNALWKRTVINGFAVNGTWCINIKQMSMYWHQNVSLELRAFKIV